MNAKDIQAFIPSHPVIAASKEQVRTMTWLMSGDAAYAALQVSVDGLLRSAPADHDVLIQAFGLEVLNVKYIAPHTFVFEGLDGEGHAAFAACHFSQLVAHVVFIPKRGADRVVTGFAKTDAAQEGTV